MVHLNKMTQQIVQILQRSLGLFIFVGFFWMVGRSAWQNHLIQKQITGLQGQLNAMRAENQHQQLLLNYYQTESFRELEARRKLGLKKPDEKALAVPTGIPQAAETGESPAASLPGSEPSKKLPIWRQWVELVLKI